MHTERREVELEEEAAERVSVAILMLLPVKF
jgi:hypothetical protein